MSIKKTLIKKLDSPIWIIVIAFLLAGAMPLLDDGDGPCNTCVPLTQVYSDYETEKPLSFEEIAAINIIEDKPSK